MLLGINEGINSAVVVLNRGHVAFALQEERIRREKNFMGFPDQALAFTLDYLGVAPGDFEAVCLSNAQSQVFSRQQFLAAYDATADRRMGHVIEEDVTNILRKSFGLLPNGAQSVIRRALGRDDSYLVERRLVELGFSQRQIRRRSHHFLHAASAYYALRANPVDPHIVLTLDGGGDRRCAQVYIAERGRLRLLAETAAGHSVGNLYSRMTHLMGMTPHEHEYKLMGLAAYRERDKYVQPVIDRLYSYLDLDPAAPLTFRCKVPELTYSIEPRMAADFKRVRFDNLAAGLQFYTEDLLLRWVRAVVSHTGIRNLVCAGGVFMNVKANKRIAELPEVEYFDVFPSCGDETLPFGSVFAEYADSSSTGGDDIVFDTLCLGPEAAYDFAQVRHVYSDRLYFEDLPDVSATLVSLLKQGRIVAHCQGPMEFGARALGNRSILADPGDVRVIPLINKMIKQRDFWMPFAPAILVDAASKYLKVPETLPKRISPWMMHTFDTTERREEFAAAVHPYDKTARAQIVSEDTNPGFYALLKRYAEVLGKEVVLNTSFNVHGFPIVMGTRDAVEVMLNSSLDYLVINNTLVTKREWATSS
jgi:carbamoyltransferase